MKSFSVTSVLLTTLVLASPPTVEAQVLQPNQLCSEYSGAAIATFEDANLQARVGAALSVGAEDGLTCRRVSRLTRLDAEQAGIKSLVGIQNLTSLTGLRLQSNSISDISALSGLTGLTSLYLAGNSITDISVLAGLTSLTSLDLAGNSITDISVLAGLTSLTSLDLAGNSISDISALSRLTSATSLRLGDNSVTDISAVSDLTGLKYLSLGGNSITDISAVSGLTSLELLRLHDNSISDISAMSGLTSLTNLNLSRNPGLADIQPLLDNPALGAGNTVFLSGTNVSCTEVAALIGVYVVGIAPCSATLSTSGLAGSTASVSGTTELIQERSYQFEEAGLRMEYQLYVPTTYDAAAPSPLLVLLHGENATPGQIIRYQGFTDLAEERGYIVVAPMGYNLRGGYGAYWSGVTAELSERDVMNVLELTLEEFNVDRDRIYLAGHAMGGTGTLHLAIKYPDIWAALGPVAQGVGKPSLNGLPEITHIPVIMVHGDVDRPRRVEISRAWVARMAELGMTYRYIENPGGDHFSIIRRDPDNVQAIFDFFDQARRN